MTRQQTTETIGEPEIDYYHFRVRRASQVANDSEIAAAVALAAGHESPEA